MSTKFPVGFLDELFAQLPPFARSHLLFNWSSSLETKIDVDIIDLCNTITVLDFFSFRRLDFEKFKKLAHLNLTNLTTLDLSQSRCLDPEDTDNLLAFIASCPCFDTVETLDLSSFRLETIQPLVQGFNSFPRLETLNCSNNPHLDFSDISTCEKFPQLKTLDLSQTDGSIKALASAKITFRLELLNFSENRTNHKDLIAFFRSPNASELRHLFLFNTSTSAPTINAIVQEQLLPKLQSIDLSCTPLTDESIIALCESPVVSNLVSLRLGGAAPADEALEVIGKSPHLSNLKSLTLTPGPFSSLAPLLSHLKSKLHIFDISYGTLVENDFELLATAECLSQLKELTMAYIQVAPNPDPTANPIPMLRAAVSNKILTTGLEKLAESPNISNLTHLSLKNFPQPMSTKVIKTLLTSPMLSNNLVELSLSSHRAGLECCALLGTHEVGGVWQRSTTNDNDNDKNHHNNHNNNNNNDNPQSNRTNSDEEVEPAEAVSSEPVPIVIQDNNTTQSVNEEDKPRLKFANLRKLHLEVCDIGPKCIASLTSLQNLTDLSLKQTKCGNVGLRSILHHKESTATQPIVAFPLLRKLLLANCNIGTAGILELSKSQLLDQLHSLVLWEDVREDRGCTALVASNLVSNLRFLQTRVLVNPPEDLDSVKLLFSQSLEDYCELSVTQWS